jgi:apolipoprotein N-acyltransferase
MLRPMNDEVRSLPAGPRWRPTVATVACVLAGVMMTTAMPPFAGTGPLVLPALAIFFHLLRAAPHPGRLAFWFALGHQATLLIWLFYLDPAKSIPTRALVPLQAIAAILFVVAHYWLFGLAVGLVRRRLGTASVLPLLPVLWLLVELLRSVGELGFPWCLTGAAWLDTPLQPLYAAAGEIGLGAATALTAALLVVIADLLRAGRLPRAWQTALALATVVCWTGLWYGSRPVPAPPAAAAQRTAPLLAAAVQADVTQADKWDPARIDSTIVPYTALTRQAVAAGAELVVWAETAVPAYLRYDRDLWVWVQQLAQEGAVPILLGFPDARLVPGELDAEGNRRYERFNAAGIFAADGELVDTYAKHHLVPLGEAIPFQRWLPWLGRIDVGQAEWTPGARPGPLPIVTELGAVPLIPSICFEAVFSHLVRQAVRDGGRVLVNITNDGWFGHRAGPSQHAALSRIRAVECGVPLVRSANNGISMICGPDGQVRAALDLHRRGVILAEIETTGPVTWFVRAGFWPVIGFMLLWAALVAPLARRDRSADSTDEP